MFTFTIYILDTVHLILVVLNLEQVLSEALPSALCKISFPKSMRWNSEVCAAKQLN